jgi:hypothetical protein
MSTKIETSFNSASQRYELCLLTDIPEVKIKNALNFRIFSIKNNVDQILYDPILQDCNYVFNLNLNFTNKNIYFIFSFKKEEFEKIKEINFGLCHEHISWIIKDIIYLNEYFVVQNNVGEESHTERLEEAKVEKSVDLVNSDYKELSNQKITSVTSKSSVNIKNIAKRRKKG